jgi:hypothetical protein
VAADRAKHVRRVQLPEELRRAGREPIHARSVALTMVSAR